MNTGYIRPCAAPYRRLYPKQEEVMAYILATVAAEQRFPSMREISDYMGWKQENSAIDVCQRLSYKGFLASSGRRQYSLPEVAP